MKNELHLYQRFHDYFIKLCRGVGLTVTRKGGTRVFSLCDVNQPPAHTHCDEPALVQKAAAFWNGAFTLWRAKQSKWCSPEFPVKISSSSLSHSIFLDCWSSSERSLPLAEHWCFSSLTLSFAATPQTQLCRKLHAVLFSCRNNLFPTDIFFSK